MRPLPILLAVLFCLAGCAAGLHGAPMSVPPGRGSDLPSGPGSELPDSALVQGDNATPVAITSQIPAAPGMRFGIDSTAVKRFEEKGALPDYGTVWVGKWDLDQGWAGTDQAIAQLRQENVTPALHFYYWGDDMRPECFTASGCNGKDVMRWGDLAQQLVQHMQSDLQGGTTVVILESEFNKHGVQSDEDLDQMLADKATFIKQGYPAAQVVLGLGNWYPEAWATWDRAAAACDYVGLQAMAASTRDSETKEVDLLNATLAGAKRLHELFGKPIFITDVAVSSYPEPDHLKTQTRSLARFAAGMPQLQEAGVEAIVYRSFLDVPDMGLGNHYAEAERHWGLAWADSGKLKPAGEAWLSAVHKAHHPEESEGQPKGQGKDKGKGQGDDGTSH